MKVRARAKIIADRTKDAYSFDRYGYISWRACCAMLLRRGFSDKEVEQIMRSRTTRAAADFNGKAFDTTSADLARHLKDSPWDWTGR